MRSQPWSFGTRLPELPHRGLPYHYVGVPTSLRPLTLLLGDGGDEFAAEVGDVGDHAAPDQVAFAERRLVNPRRAGVLQVIFDPQRARGPRPIDYAGRDRDEPAVADDADGLVPVVHAPDEVRDLGIAPQLVRRPAPRHHDAVQLRGVDTVRCRVGLRYQRVLSADRFDVGADGDDLCPFFLQAHHRDPVLEVLETLGHENRDLLPFQSHRDSPRMVFTRVSLN